MAKTRGVIASTDQYPELLEGILEGLFPRHDLRPWPPFVGHLGTGASDDEKVTDEELAGTAMLLSVCKAPGPDGIPNQQYLKSIKHVSMQKNDNIQGMQFHPYFNKVQSSYHYKTRIIRALNDALQVAQFSLTARKSFNRKDKTTSQPQLLNKQTIPSFHSVSIV